MISLLLGMLVRCMPEIFSLFQKKADNDHEYRMLQAQIEIEKATAADKLATVQQQGAVDQGLADTSAQMEALKGQMQALTIPLTGVKWLDALDAFIATVVNALNMLVRPTTTYYFLGLFGIYKAALLQVAMSQTGSVWSAILQVYDPSDKEMLAGIVGFWFMGRVFDKLTK